MKNRVRKFKKKTYGAFHFLWDQNFLETWKSIPNYFFEKYGGFYFLVRCDYDEKFFKKIEHPTLLRTNSSKFSYTKDIARIAE